MHLRKDALGFLILLSLFTSGKLLAKAKFYAAHTVSITVHDSDDGNANGNDTDGDDGDDGDDDDDIDSMC